MINLRARWQGSSHKPSSIIAIERIVSLLLFVVAAVVDSNTVCKKKSTYSTLYRRRRRSESRDLAATLSPSVFLFYKRFIHTKCNARHPARPSVLASNAKYTTLTRTSPQECQPSAPAATGAKNNTRATSGRTNSLSWGRVSAHARAARAMSVLRPRLSHPVRRFAASEASRRVSVSEV